MMEKDASHVKILELFESAGSPPYTVYSDISEPIKIFPECSVASNLALALRDKYTTAVSFEIGGSEQKFDLREEDCGLRIH